MSGSAAVSLGEPTTRYPLGPNMAVVITGTTGQPQPAWECRVQATTKSGGWREVTDDDGAAQAFVDVLRHTVTVPAEGFRVVRLVPPPEATGERPVEAKRPERPDRSVVVGERVVVTWVHRLGDREHPAPLTLAHLAERRFLGVPVTHGMLTWQSPNGRELPCAVATGYLPRSRDGWAWCPDLVEQKLGLRRSGGLADTAGLGRLIGPLTGPLPVADSWIDDFPARIGRLAAKLHVALATPSSLLPEPVQEVGPERLRSWHEAAAARVQRVVDLTRTGALDDGEHVLLPRVTALRAAVDGLSALADTFGPGDGVVVQRIHGDLHAGQFVRWPGGLAVVDFDADPALAGDELTSLDDPITQPAARDVAQLLLSLDHVGRVIDARHGFRSTESVDAWSTAARAQLLDAYRAELEHADLGSLFDERLLPAFEAEQVCREILWATRHRPEWLHASLAGLRLMMPPEDGYPGPSGRHRAPDA
jgi:maltokinase